MKSRFRTYLTAVLVGATLGGLVVNPQVLLVPLTLLGLGSGPVVMFLIVRSIVKGPAGNDAEATSSDQTLPRLRARLERAAAEHERLSRQIAELEAEGSSPPSRVVVEAEQIARAVARRKQPPSSHA